MDQPSDNVGQNPKKTFFSNAPLFVGFNPKSSESDSVRSPTSPLDLRVFSFLGNPLRSKRSSHEKVWYRNKVGLSIVDSLDFESDYSGKVIRASDSSKNILFKPQLRTKPMDSKTNNLSYARTEVTKSLPKYVANLPYPSKKESSNVCFEIGDSSTSFRSFSFDSRQSRSRLSRLSESSSLFCPRSPVSDRNFLNGDIPPSEIELSEDYTCVKIHGPNPKVTHIFCDCILECKSNNGSSQSKDDEKGKSPVPSMAYPFSDFLRFCYSCKKNLDGEDIYMYRGEKAFCSSNCRLQVILLDEEMEKSNVNSCDGSSERKNGNESSIASLFISP